MNLPKIGFGTWQLAEGRETEEAVTAALDCGYRLIDTAKIYGNERSVGQAIKNSSADRSEIIVTTKLWQSDMGYASALAAFDESLSKLGLDYVDIYLIHWPGSGVGARKDSWRALEELQASGKVKNIGVSNYSVHHLEEMNEYAKQKPFVNQIEFHPFIYREQKETLDYCSNHGIAVEAYSPLAQARQMNNQVLKGIAEAHSVTLAQVMLAWAMAHSTIPLPRSSNKDRIAQNFEAINITLDAQEIESINSLSSGKSALG